MPAELELNRMRFPAQQALRIFTNFLCLRYAAPGGPRLE